MYPLLQFKWTWALIFIMIGSFLTAQSPIVNYTFSGNVKDEASNQSAQVNAVKLTQDRHGWASSAVLLDGEQSAITAPAFAALNSDYATVSMWTKAASLPVQGEVFLISFGGWQERFKVSVPSHGKVVWTTNNSSGISDMDSGDNGIMAVGAWQHWVFVHDGAQDAIYLNGQKIAEKAVSGTLNATTQNVGIGYNNIDNANFFHGSIDEVRMYNVALNADAVAALYAAQIATPAVPNAKVVHYALNGNGIDSGDYRNDIAISNGTYTTDRFGYGNSALVFNGESTQATAANHGAVNSDYTTIGFWVKMNKLPISGESFLLSNGGWQERIKISVPEHGKVVFTTNGSSGISDMDAGGGNELVPGEWKHIVFVHDGTEDKIFMNGVRVASKGVSGTLNSTSHPLSLGYNVIDGGNYLDGTLDEVTIYNYALSDGDILNWYTQSSTFNGTVPDVVAQYDFAGDLSDNTIFNNGLDGEAAFTANRFGWGGNALHLDGTQGVKAANSSRLNSEYMTASFWVNPTELPVAGEAFLISSGGWQERFKISVPAHGKVVFTSNSTSGISDMDAGGGNELVPGQWSHVAVVHDGTNDKIFINGVLANSKAVSGALNSTKHPLGIGYDPIDNGGYFNGKIDDVQLYNKALTDAEILALYNNQNATPVVSGDLTANYTFTANTNDATAYRNHAESNNAQLTTDRFGKPNSAYAFNGVDAQITAENSAQQNTPFTTIAFWVNVNNLPVSGEAFLLTNGGWQERWKISLPSHGKPVFTTNNTSGISDMDSGDGNALVAGEWKHVVMTHDGSFDKIYMNGVEVASKAVTGGLNSTTHPLGMGYNAVDGGNYLDGSLDEVRLYNKALTAAEVLALYNEQNTPTTPTDTEAPESPLDVMAMVQYTDVTLTWRASNDNVGVTGYNIYVDGAVNRTVTEETTTYQGLAQLTEYEFGVSAIDAEGNESPVTKIKATTGEEETPDVTPPTPPGNLTGITGSNSVLLSWEPSVDDRKVEGYVVFVDGDLYDTIPGTATSVLVGGLDPETPYSFEIYAFDKAGNNSDIEEITLTTEAELNTGEPGMVAYYPFDGNANDATAYANHGVIGGNPVFDVPTHANGGSHYIKFDGDQDSVLVANAVHLISDYVSMGFWVRVDDIKTSDAESYLINFGDWDQRMKVSIPHHTRIVFTTNAKSTQLPNHIVDMDSKDGNELVKGHWWHVVVTHDGVENKIFVNGELANNVPAPGTLNPTNRPMGFGNNPYLGGQYFNGGLDELKIYNRALTDQEVKSLYTGGSIGTKDVVSVPSWVESVYPSPTRADVYVKHAFPENQDLTLRVFDLMGRQVDEIKFNQGAVPTGVIRYDTKNLQQGEYFMNFVTGQKSAGTVKFSKM